MTVLPYVTCLLNQSEQRYRLNGLLQESGSADCRDRPSGRARWISLAQADSAANRWTFFWENSSALKAFQRMESIPPGLPKIISLT